MDARRICPGPPLLMLFCWGQLLPWLRTEGDQSQSEAEPQRSVGPDKGTRRADHSQDSTVPTSLSAELYNETMAQSLLEIHERTAQMVWNQFTEAAWNYVTNITNKNLEEMVWYRSHSSPFSLAHLWGLRGWGSHTFCPLSRARGKEGNPKVHVKAGGKLCASWWHQTLSGQESLAVFSL